MTINKKVSNIATKYRIVLKLTFIQSFNEQQTETKQYYNQTRGRSDKRL